MRLANKMTVITGGNSGIGLATARLFAAGGARNAKTLNAAATELGTELPAVQADVADGDAIKQAMTGAEIVLDGGATNAPLAAPIYRAAGELPDRVRPQ